MSGQQFSIVAGDCVDVMADMREKSVDLIIADPPYNVSGRGLCCEGSATGGNWYKMDSPWDCWDQHEYFEFTRRWIAHARRIVTPSGALWVCCTAHNLGEILLALKETSFKINNVVTWYKSNAMPNMTRRVFTHACEFLVWAVAGSGWTFNYDLMKDLNPERRRDGTSKQMRDLWGFPVCQGRERLKSADRGRALHPTQKPEALIERVVLATSSKGDVVLDPFMGTGTTAVVSLRHNRRFMGIERDTAFFEAARARIERQINHLSG